MKDCRHKISRVKEGSIAWELELQPGDELLIQVSDGCIRSTVHSVEEKIREQAVCEEA